MRRIFSSFVAGIWLFSVSCAGPQPGDSPERWPFILLTNDDGVDAPGLKALHEELKKIGDVLVVAPAANSSGSSQSLPVEGAVHVKKLPESGTYAVEGPPALCVLLAVENLAEGRRLDLVVSGINNGENLGLDIPISGTIGAARMAADLGIPAIAFSLAYGSKEHRAAAELSVKLVREALKRGLDPGLIVNVNFPRSPPSEWKKPLIAPPGGRGFALGFKRKEGPGEDLVFEPHLAFFKGLRPEGSDSWAFSEGHVTVTPLATFGSTPDAAKALASWSFFEK